MNHVLSSFNPIKSEIIRDIYNHFIVKITHGSLAAHRKLYKELHLKIQKSKTKLWQKIATKIKL